MGLHLEVQSGQGQRLAYAYGESQLYLVYAQAHQPGDILRLWADTPCFLVAQLEDSICPAYGFLSGPLELAVPFKEKRASYSPKSFVGEVHLLQVRLATPGERGMRRNLALNPLDSHGNSGFFPHAHANVETRGESVFAARNAIDGQLANGGHGPWPYQSWGINRQEDARITIDFGRDVFVDEIVLTTRADFPHDSWWTGGKLSFSDGSEEDIRLAKSHQSQAFPIAPRQICQVTLHSLVKAEDPSPFPALTQIEVWGWEKDARS